MVEKPRQEQMPPCFRYISQQSKIALGHIRIKMRENKKPPHQVKTLRAAVKKSLLFDKREVTRHSGDQAIIRRIACPRTIKGGIAKPLGELLPAETPLVRHNVESHQTAIVAKKLGKRHARPTNAAAEIK